MSRRDEAKQRRRAKIYIPSAHVVEAMTRAEIELRRVVARQCKLDVALVHVPVGLSREDARRLPAHVLAERAEHEPVVADYVIPHPLRHDKPVRFEDAVKAYDQRVGRAA